LQGSEINDAKKVLATSATALLHGADAAREAAETSEKTFESGVTADGLPTTDVPKAELESGIALFALLARAGLAGSNSEGRRLIKGGGARVNDVAVAEETAEITADSINDDGVIKLSAGKKRHALIRPV